MNDINSLIEKINRFLENYIFEAPIAQFPNTINVNVKTQITGVNKYILFGEKKDYFEYTLYILPTNTTNDYWSYTYREIFGDEKIIDTRSQDYYSIRVATDDEIANILKYFGVDMEVICTKVVNKIEKRDFFVSKNTIKEGKLDNPVRTIVRDIITLFKNKKVGEYGLPEDLYPEQLTYTFNNIPEDISLLIEFRQDNNVDTVEIDADYYNDDFLIDVSIIYNPMKSREIIFEMIGELNEVIRHEIEHLLQYKKGYEFPKKEPKKPLKYYTQKHEIDAMKKGFRRGSKIKKVKYEDLVRSWFQKYQHKHNLNPKQIEFVISKIISEK